MVCRASLISVFMSPCFNHHRPFPSIAVFIRSHRLPWSPYEPLDKTHRSDGSGYVKRRRTIAQAATHAVIGDALIVAIISSSEE